MLFNLEYDAGHTIEGYVIPDGFSEEANIIVTIDDGRRLQLPCDQVRQAVVQSGRHATGLVGFKIDTTHVADLEMQRHLSVHDMKTGLLVYRRPKVENPVPMKLLRLELTMLPMQKFDQYCGYHFQYALSSAERFGHETTLQAFHLNGISSIYISGRLLLRNYDEFLDKGFQAIVDIPDPYYEMASRLFVLKRLSKGPVSFIGDRDKIILSSAVEHFADTNLDDERQLARVLKRAPDKVRNVLRSPIIRQFVCTYPEQPVSRRDVAPAIDILSRFTVVGSGDDNEHFQNAVGELIGLPGSSLPIIPRHSLLKDLGNRLKRMPIAELILEEDLIFDHYVRQAAASHVA